MNLESVKTWCYRRSLVRDNISEYVSFVNILSWCQRYMLKYVNSHKSSIKNKQTAKPLFVLLSEQGWAICSSSCGAMAVSRWVPFQLVSLLEMPAAEPHKQPEEEWFPLNRETRVHGFLLWLNRVWRLSSRPDSSLLPQKALSYTFSCIQWGVGSNPPILHMSKWRPQEAGET